MTRDMKQDFKQGLKQYIYKEVDKAIKNRLNETVDHQTTNTNSDILKQQSEITPYDELLKEMLDYYLGLMIDDVNCEKDMYETYLRCDASEMADWMTGKLKGKEFLERFLEIASSEMKDDVIRKMVSEESNHDFQGSVPGVFINVLASYCRNKELSSYANDHLEGYYLKQDL